MERIFSHLNSSSPTEIETKAVYSLPELAFPADGICFDSLKRPYIYFNMVSSLDGHATTGEGSAEGLGSETDRTLMYKLRSAADAVLCGASTFRRDPFLPIVKDWLAEERANYFPESPQPLGCVISKDGNLPQDKKFWWAGRDSRVVFLGEGAKAESLKWLEEKAQVFRVGLDSEGNPELAVMLDILYSQLGVKRLLVEGGPTLNYALLSHGFGDEFFLTTAPQLLGGGKLSIINGKETGFPAVLKLDLLSIYRNRSELFLRYKIQYG
ncbi:RibD family protein [Candidatus Chlorohelix sp.]|uniref:RibD family protein n=1 Tax=Candidatus Chlorohelix sp. TaxID=3139201 RepID=UPI00303675D1